jgi:tRNA/tmRNA/rRNA uracil-C5-methylase (TrmA/RlmC/RlmD family)
MYDVNIIKPQIIDKINFLISKKIIELSDKNKYEIKCTEYTWMFKISNQLDDLEHKLDILLSDKTLVYLSINSIIYKNNMMIEEINNIQISYNPLSFRQSDDSIKNKLYDIISFNVLSKKLYLIGGEMVFFAKFLKPTKFYMYTDFESIYNDARINFPSDIHNIQLINYEYCKLYCNSEKDFHIIANTSKSGLGKNLCNEILNLELTNITIISCNKKSFSQDYKILSSRYYIEKTFELKTNYSVYVIFLHII